MERLHLGIVGCGEVTQVMHLPSLRQLGDQFAVTAICDVSEYGDFVCQFETGIDNIPRFDAHLEVYGEQQVLWVQYDTPYVRNLPIRLSITAANGRGGAVERSEHPAWGDAFVAEWRAFHANVVEGRQPKTGPADFRQDLELFSAMVAHERDVRA